jgi:phenylalanine-4-hydroxylase
MAFRIGGVKAVRKAIECEMTSTCELSSGLQISGTFSDVLEDANGGVAYIKTSSPTSLAYENSELAAHNKEYHADGFGSPVGWLRDIAAPLENLSENELADLGIRTGQEVRLAFRSGVDVVGTLQKITRKDGKNLIFTFENCTVTMGDQRFFEPEWGAYDMAVGASVDSVYAGAADKDAFDPIDLVPGERTIKVDYDAMTRKLHQLYRDVREIREQDVPVNRLADIWREVQDNHPRDWLLSLEILEVLTVCKSDSPLAGEIRVHLENRAKNEPDLAKLIGDGLYLVDHPLPPL